MSYASLFDDVPETEDVPAWKPDIEGTELLGKVVDAGTVTLNNDFGVKEALMWTVQQENGALIRLVGARTVLGNQMSKHPNPKGKIVQAIYKGLKGGGNRRSYHNYTVKVVDPGASTTQATPEAHSAATPAVASAPANAAPPWAV
jgi:hypothetical protein